MKQSGLCLASGNTYRYVAAEARIQWTNDAGSDRERNMAMKRPMIDVLGVVVYCCAVVISLHFLVEPLGRGHEMPSRHLNFLLAGPILAFSAFRLYVLARKRYG